MSIYIKMVIRQSYIYGGNLCIGKQYCYIALAPGFQAFKMPSSNEMDRSSSQHWLRSRHQAITSTNADLTSCNASDDKAVAVTLLLQLWLETNFWNFRFKQSISVRSLYTVLYAVCILETKEWRSKEPFPFMIWSLTGLVFSLWHKHKVVYLVFSCDQAALWTVFSVRLSVCHTFLTMFPLSYHHEIFRSYH